tara:strand:+ start:747 stop:1418 length:672 start_codon:yes stop_codon:yes gene_type:complete
MDLDEQHVVWKQQLQKLILSNQKLKETDSANILIHFFTQVIERDFCHELETTKQQIKQVTKLAIHMAPTLRGTLRSRAVVVLSRSIPLEEPIVQNVRLNDLRNILVFEIFKRCGMTIDTYFERYSSPPGTVEQSAAYINIAHGKATCTAAWANKLSFVINIMDLLKTVFLVYDIFTGVTTETTAANLNWHGAKWAVYVSQRGLGDLVWNTFLDVWEYEHSVYK